MNLTVEHLSFSYHRHAVLKDVSFSLEQGELLCVLGPNGVGKSTLFRCILGLQRGYTGRVLLQKEDTGHLPPKVLAKKIAYIPQYSTPAFQYSVFHTVLMGTTSQLTTLSSPGERQECAALDALERLGIAHLGDRNIGTLSGGERQLVLIARALAQNANLLVMDEPTASLDYGNAVRVLEMVRELTGQGYGVILSTHDPSHALRYANRALILNHGQVQSFGVPEVSVTAQTLSEAYGVPIQVEELNLNGVHHRVCIPSVSG